MRFWQPQFIAVTLLVFAIICALATLVDSIQSKQAFIEQLRNLEADSINRVFEREGEEGLRKMTSIFSAEELFFTRRKKREYNFMIIIKLFFVIIFVVLFFNML